MTVALISNRWSHRNKRGLASVEAVAGRYPDLLHVRLDGIDGLPAALADAVRRPVAAIALNGGDGTIQAALTCLHALVPPAELPPLVILRGGRTNLIADDVGPRDRTERALPRLMQAVATASTAPVTVHRHILRIDNVDGAPFLCGMFLGIGGIVAAIDLCKTEAHAIGLESNLASVITLARAIIDWLFSRGDSALFRSLEMTVSIDDGGPQRVRRAAVLVTTLDRLMLGFRPFWNTVGGPVRLTGIAAPPYRLLRYAPRLLYGGERREIPAATADSQSGSRIAVEMDGRFVLDGEMHRPLPGKPLVISAVGPLRFLRI